jgi:signal peptidase II
MKAVPRHRYLLFAAIVVTGCAVDLATKDWIFARLGMPREAPSQWLVDEVFGFTTSLNEGALFGVGQGRGLIFSALSILAAIGICYWLFAARAAHDLLLTVALALVTGGILGNLYDRLGLPGLHWTDGTFHEPGEPVYAVRDWLDFRLIDWPIFNIADSLLVCGAGLLIWHALRGERPARPDESVSGRASPTDLTSDRGSRR